MSKLFFVDGFAELGLLNMQKWVLHFPGLPKTASAPHGYVLPVTRGRLTHGKHTVKPGAKKVFLHCIPVGCNGRWRCKIHEGSHGLGERLNRFTPRRMPAETAMKRSPCQMLKIICTLPSSSDGINVLRLQCCSRMFSEPDC